MINSIDSYENIYSFFQFTLKNATSVYLSIPKATYFCVISMAFFVYYFREIVKKPTLVCRNEKFRNFLVNNCSLVREKFYPSFWCYGNHGQTIVTNMIRELYPILKYKREIIVMNDGGETSLDWYEDTRQKKDRFSSDEETRPINFVIPGLTGHSNTQYIRTLVPISHSVGYRVVVMNNRGRGGMKLKTPRLYCASSCEDVDKVLNQIKSKYPKAKIIATGVSLGGIVIGRYLVEKGEKSVIDAAMLVSVCFDFFNASQNLEAKTLNLAFNKFLSKNLISVVDEHLDKLKEVKNLNFEKIFKSTKLKELDEELTIKMWNYKTVNDYYADASLKNKLNLIKKPTLFLNAQDDIFQPFDSLPIEQIEKSSHVALLITSKGGHIGFMDNIIPPYYTERLNKQFLESFINLEDIKKIVE